MPRRAATGNSPHNRDEIYVIVTGSGYFVDAGTRQTVTAGTCIFVPAGANHRFEDFTDDFSTWVFFYGPAGGEAKAAS
jgi:mannose-6-phosphate isomerase-like protein (cupin superfamily)